MTEKLCPFCSKPVRSDASAKHYCTLCGMFIDDTETQYIFDANSENSLYFCCEQCMNLYITTICQDKIANTIETVEDIVEDITIEQDDAGIRTYYSKYVQEITYLRRRQVSTR
jgi:hypothetical protein